MSMKVERSSLDQVKERFNKNKKMSGIEILERVDSSNLPAYYGGSLTDADGNPKCLEKCVCWGGRVPKEFYIIQTNL